MDHTKKPLFIVLEGLDGSGKTTAAKHFAALLEKRCGASVQLTYEPHNPSCAGTFIREVLTQKIERFSPHILRLAYAANRLDHCERVIGPWLEGGSERIVISDRYYLSSLVYQVSEEYPCAAVMDINRHARRPDLIFFLEVSDAICYERLKNRNQPLELFEKNLADTRLKYHEAIRFLREQTTGHRIVEIDGGGSTEEVAESMLEALWRQEPGWKPIP